MREIILNGQVDELQGSDESPVDYLRVSNAPFADDNRRTLRVQNEEPQIQIY